MARTRGRRTRNSFLPKWLTRKEITYHRDVGAERKELIKQAKEEKRERLREQREEEKGRREEEREQRKWEREKEREQIRDARVAARYAKQERKQERRTSSPRSGDIDPGAWYESVRSGKPTVKRGKGGRFEKLGNPASKLKKGVRGLVRLEGRGRSSRLVIYT